MDIKNIEQRNYSKALQSFKHWKRATIYLLGVCICFFLIMHAQQAWSAYCCYQQATDYHMTEQRYNAMHDNLQRINEQYAAHTQQFDTVQTQCTPPVNPEGLFALPSHLPTITLHSAHITPDLVTLEATITASALAQLDTQLRTLFCNVPLIHSIKRAANALDSSLLTVSIYIKPARVCPTPVTDTSKLG